MILPTLPILMLLTLFRTALSHTLEPSQSSPKISNPYNKKSIFFSTRMYNRRRHINQLPRSNTSTFSPSKVHFSVHPIPDHSLVMEVGIGSNSTSSPMLMTELLVDTGSGLTWLQALPCNSCFGQGDFPYYDRAASKSFDPIYCQDEICETIPNQATALCGAMSWISSDEPCSYYIEYSDKCSSSGVMGTETFYFQDSSLLGNAPLELVPFGVETSNHIPDSFKGDSPGVAGFMRGYGTLLNKLGVKKFSHCFPRDEADTGILSFGKEAKITGVKVALNERSAHYEALLTNVYVSGVRMLVEYDYVLPANMVFDTGSSWTRLSLQLTDAVVEAIKSALRKYKPQQSDHCELCYNMIDISSVSLDDVAKVTFEFNYFTKIDLFSYHLWIRDDQTNLICLRFVRAETNLNLFGNNLTREMNIGHTLNEDDLAMYFNRQHCWK